MRKMEKREDKGFTVWPRQQQPATGDSRLESRGPRGTDNLAESKVRCQAQCLCMCPFHAAPCPQNHPDSLENNDEMVHELPVLWAQIWGAQGSGLCGCPALPASAGQTMTLMASGLQMRWGLSTQTGRIPACPTLVCRDSWEGGEKIRPLQLKISSAPCDSFPLLKSLAGESCAISYKAMSHNLQSADGGCKVPFHMKVAPEGPRGPCGTAP